jgi:hypothetical protein
MGKRQKTVFPGHREVVTRMIFMVVRVDHEGGAKDITEFQEFFPPVNETRVDEQAIDEKGMNPKKTEARKPADHANRIHGTSWHAMH